MNGNPLLGSDLVFQIGDGGSPEVYEDMCVEVDFGEVGEEKALIDITARCDNARRYRGGIPDGLEIPLSLLATAAGQQIRLLRNAYKQRRPLNFRLVTKDSPADVFVFIALVRAWRIIAPIGERSTYRFTLKIISDVVWDLPLPPRNPDADAIISAMVPPPSPQHAAAITALVTDWQACGAWATWDSLRVRVVHSQQAALLDWIQPGNAGRVSVPVNSPIFTPWRGFLFDGVTNLVSNPASITKFNPPTSACLIAYNWRVAQLGANPLIGGNIQSVTNRSYVNPSNATGLFGAYIGETVNVSAINDGNVGAVGLFAAQRVGTQRKLFFNGQQVQADTTAIGSPATSTIMWDGRSGSAYGAWETGMSAWGSGLTDQQHADVAAAWQVYLGAVA